MNQWNPGSFRERSQSELKELSALSQVRSIGALAAEWFTMLFAVVLHVTFPHPVIYALTVVLIGSRLYGLYSLLHDALHFLTLRNRKWNDRIAQVFMGLPLFIYVPDMRKVHFDHHKYLYSDKDPEMALLKYKEFQYPKTRFQLYKLYLLDITGINFVYYRLLKLARWLRSGRYGSFFTGPKWKMNVFYLVLFGTSIVFEWWSSLLVYWLIPYATVYQLLNRIRLSTEHFNLEEDSAFNTRSMKLNWLEGALLSPHNLGYHTEHHIFPAVPFYHLPRLHDMLSQDEQFRKGETLGTSYRKVLKKCIQ